MTRREWLKLAAVAGGTVWRPPRVRAQAAATSAKSFARVLGQRMAFRESGTGDPVVFLHGNPTSSHLWRHIIPAVTNLGRCLAPDLIGMGDSDKLSPSGPDRYTLAEHQRFLDALLDRLGVGRRVILVVHDWGSVLGFDWGRRHPDAVRGIAHMEAIVVAPTTANTPAAALDFFRSFRTPEGARAVLEGNRFVEQVLLRQFPQMAAADVAEYRRPYLTPGESRRPTLTWPQQMPIDGLPAESHDRVQAALAFMASTPVPKLFVNAEPGALVVGPRKEIVRRWPNTSEVTVTGRHYVQEESPQAIGAALAKWIAGLP